VVTCLAATDLIKYSYISTGRPALAGPTCRGPRKARYSLATGDRRLHATRCRSALYAGDYPRNRCRQRRGDVRPSLSPEASPGWTVGRRDVQGRSRPWSDTYPHRLQPTVSARGRQLLFAVPRRSAPRQITTKCVVSRATACRRLRDLSRDLVDCKERRTVSLSSTTDRTTIWNLMKRTVSFDVDLITTVLKTS